MHTEIARCKLGENKGHASCMTEFILYLCVYTQDRIYAQCVLLPPSDQNDHIYAWIWDIYEDQRKIYTIYTYIQQSLIAIKVICVVPIYRACPLSKSMIMIIFKAITNN